MASRWWRAARVLPRAVVLGVATVVQPKARPDDHWSTSPEVVVLDEVADADGGSAPPPPDGCWRLPSTV